MITSKDIKEAAKRMGADIVGIGSIDRWSTAPIQMDPKQIMPKANSTIRILHSGALKTTWTSRRRERILCKSERSALRCSRKQTKKASA